MLEEPEGRINVLPPCQWNTGHPLFPHWVQSYPRCCIGHSRSKLSFPHLEFAPRPYSTIFGPLLSPLVQLLFKTTLCLLTVSLQLLYTFTLLLLEIDSYENSSRPLITTGFTENKKSSRSLPKGRKLLFRVTTLLHSDFTIRILKSTIILPCCNVHST